jgi:hypothetical protein
VYVGANWTMAQMRRYVQRRNERIRRESSRQTGGAEYTGRKAGGLPVQEKGLAAFCAEEKRRGRVKPLRRKSERMTAAQAEV